MDRIIRSDTAENSIMQTISIAVSTILIAVGLITAPGLVANAQDNNARTDLANVAHAQETALANSGSYTESIQPGVPGSLTETGLLDYTLSADVTNQTATVCPDGRGYVLAATSASGTTVYRSSESAATVTDTAALELPGCLTTEQRATFVAATTGNLGRCVATILNGVDIGRHYSDFGDWRILGTYASLPSCAQIYQPGALLDGSTITWVDVTWRNVNTNQTQQSNVQIGDLVVW